MKLLHIAIITLFVLQGMQAQSISEHIHIDQFGYLPNSPKVAVLSNPQQGFNNAESFSPGNTLEVRKSSDHQAIFTGTPTSWNDGQTHDQSGDQGWWFDFSSLSTPGDYYIFDPANNLKSYDFKIEENVYSEVLKAAGRMFYYNRCNTPKVQPYAESNWTDGSSFDGPLQDVNCRYVYDSLNAALEKDLSGGWFDAGDYNKYVTFANSAVHDLLSAFEENPNAFGDDWNIPESSNGIPDIIDELKWELDWLMKMNNADGSTQIKMGGTNFENSDSPPSINTKPRYYGPICSSASIAIASMFAHAAHVFNALGGMDNYVVELTTRAESSWAYALGLLDSDSLQTDCDDGTINAGDADWDEATQKENMLTAAIHLFRTTEKSSYNDYIIANISDAESVSNGWWGPYKNTTNSALLLYTTLPGNDVTTKNAILNSLLPHVQGDWDNFFGFNELDLYRAFMPSWSYHWGSNMPKANYGNLNQLFIKYGIETSQHDNYLQKMEEHIHYFHGVNPLNMVHLSNMYTYGAGNCANEIYHSWFNDGTDYDHALTSTFGPAPGFLTGGPNKDYGVNTQSPPYGQPEQKSYLDFNTGFPINSWEITEPAIYYQAAYIRLLANFYANGSVTTESTNLSLSQNDIEILPNPIDNYFIIRGTLSEYSILVINQQGQVVDTMNTMLNEAVIDTSQYNSGIYFVQVQHKNNAVLCVKKIIKP